MKTNDDAAMHELMCSELCEEMEAISERYEHSITDALLMLALFASVNITALHLRNPGVITKDQAKGVVLAWLDRFLEDSPDSPPDWRLFAAG